MRTPHCPGTPRWERLRAAPALCDSWGLQRERSELNSIQPSRQCRSHGRPLHFVNIIYWSPAVKRSSDPKLSAGLTKIPCAAIGNGAFQQLHVLPAAGAGRAQLGGGTGRAGRSRAERSIYLQVLWLARPALIITAIHKHERVKYSHPPAAI